MSIEKSKIKPGIFIVRYSKRNPITRKSVDLKRQAKSIAEAKRIERELIVEVEKLIHRSVVPTWLETLEKFLIASKDRGLTDRTIYDYASVLRAHTLEAWGNRGVDEISTQDIREILHSRLGKNKASHQKYVLKGIRAVFSFAVESAWIMRNPTPHVKFKLGDKIKPVLTEEQARTLLFRAQEQCWEWYFHYALALYTGMRNGELYALSWDKVDLDQRTILVNLSWNSKDGFKGTKSGDDRIVEIAPGLTPILNELKSRSCGSEFVLPRLTRWESGEQARDLRVFLKSIGLPVIRFHDLRATWATMLLSKGVEPIKVMKMGGWKDLETMMIYARKAGVDIRGSTDCLNLHGPDNQPGKVLRLAEAK
jgi:integrase